MARHIAAPLAALLLMAACSSSAPAPSTELVLGAIYPLSGSQGQGGREELGGVRAALRLAEQSGVLGGRQLRLLVVDVRSPQGATAAVDRLVDTDHVPAIIGTYGSTLADAAAARAEQRQVFYLETGAVADAITWGRPYVFRTVATGGNLGRAAVQFTAELLLPAGGLAPARARAVIVHVNDAYGRSVADGQEEQAAQAGIPVVDNIEYDPRAFDAPVLAQRVAADHADYLWDVSYLDDAVAIWHALVAAGVQLRGAVGTSSAFCMPAFGQRLGSEALGVFAADKPDDTISEAALAPSARALLAQARSAYRAETGSESMSIAAVAGFVGGWTLFHHILPGVAGRVGPEALRAAAYRVDVPAGAEIDGGGVRFAGPDSLDPGQNQRPAVVVGQWQAGVVMKVVYPPGYAEAAPVPAQPAAR